MVRSAELVRKKERELLGKVELVERREVGGEGGLVRLLARGIGLGGDVGASG